jgi:hypothetical protein
MSRARAKALQEKVTSLLSMCEFDVPLDGILHHASTLCILRYQPQGNSTMTLTPTLQEDNEKKEAHQLQDWYYRLED